MSLTVAPRSPALAPFVDTIGYYESDLPFGRERVLPGGNISLMVNLYEDEMRTYGSADSPTPTRYRGAILGGPRSTATIIDTDEQRCMIGVNFRVGGAYPFFSTPIDETRDAHIEIEDLWGADARSLRDRLIEAPTPEAKIAAFEAALLERVVRPLERDRTVARAARELGRGALVAEVAEELGMLPKRLASRFCAQVGLTPKRYARVRRLQRTVKSVVAAGEIDWADVAVEHGYYDQSHLINEFRELGGITPTAYRPRTAHEQNHVPLQSC